MRRVSVSHSGKQVRHECHHEVYDTLSEKQNPKTGATTSVKKTRDGNDHDNEIKRHRCCVGLVRLSSKY